MNTEKHQMFIFIFILIVIAIIIGEVNSRAIRERVLRQEVSQSNNEYK